MAASTGICPSWARLTPRAAGMPQPSPPPSQKKYRPGSVQWWKPRTYTPVVMASSTTAMPSGMARTRAWAAAMGSMGARLVALAGRLLQALDLGRPAGPARLHRVLGGADVGPLPHQRQEGLERQAGVADQAEADGEGAPELLRIGAELDQLGAVGQGRAVGVRVGHERAGADGEDPLVGREGRPDGGRRRRQHPGEQRVGGRQRHRAVEGRGVDRRAERLGQVGQGVDGARGRRRRGWRRWPASRRPAR